MTSADDADSAPDTPVLYVAPSGATYVIAVYDSPDAIPNPAVLMGFDQIKKGLAAALVEEALKEGEHRRAIELMLVRERVDGSKGRARHDLVAQIGAITSVIVTGFVAVWFAHVGSPYLGWSIFGGTLLSIVYAFLSIRRPATDARASGEPPGRDTQPHVLPTHGTVVRPPDKSIESGQDGTA